MSSSSGIDSEYPAIHDLAISDWPPMKLKHHVYDDAAGLSNGASVTVAVETQSQVALETTASSSINGSQVGTVSIVGEIPDHDANANVGAVDWPPMRLKCHFYGELPNPSEVADSGKELHPSRNGAVVISCKYFGLAKALQGFVLVEFCVALTICTRGDLTKSV